MSVRKSVDALRDDLGQVKGDLVLLTGELGALAQVGTQEAKDRLLARTAVLQSKALALQKQIRRGLNDGVGYLDEQVQGKPYCTAIAVGVLSGLVVWLMTRPRE